MIVLSIFAVLLLVLAWWTLRGNFRPVGAVDVGSLLEPVDLPAFENLIDPAQDDFLKNRLTGSAFRSVQRARRMAAVGYLWRVARNSGWLIRAGESARTAAITMRVLALLAIIRLCGALAFPSATMKCASFVTSYNILTSTYAHLGMILRSDAQAM